MNFGNNPQINKKPSWITDRMEKDIVVSNIESLVRILQSIVEKAGSAHEGVQLDADLQGMMDDVISMTMEFHAEVVARTNRFLRKSRGKSDEDGFAGGKRVKIEVINLESSPEPSLPIVKPAEPSTSSAPVNTRKNVKNEPDEPQPVQTMTNSCKPLTTPAPQLVPSIVDQLLPQTWNPSCNRPSTSTRPVSDAQNPQIQSPNNSQDRFILLSFGGLKTRSPARVLSLIGIPTTSADVTIVKIGKQTFWTRDPDRVVFEIDQQRTTALLEMCDGNQCNLKNFSNDPHLKGMMLAVYNQKASKKEVMFYVAHHLAQMNPRSTVDAFKDVVTIVTGSVEKKINFMDVIDTRKDIYAKVCGKLTTKGKMLLDKLEKNLKNKRHKQ
ncbi:unnamed protein product [Caenorhabditis sp. 36 PRJEB53466]|nr:unnamed protein product [Caenorhabditis sp. 36 PRJEB53466]